MRTRRFHNHQRPLIEILTDHEFSAVGLESRGHVTEQDQLDELVDANGGDFPGCNVCGFDPVVILPEGDNGLDAA